MKRAIVITLALTILTGITDLRAWSVKGHMLVGYVADQHLTPEARKACHHYLRHTLSYYGSWLDQVRYTEDYRQTQRWHASSVDARTGKYINTGSGAALNIMRIQSEMEDGRYRSLSDSAIIDNIKSLIHMVGDMHCPSHTGYPDQPGFKGYNIYRSGKATKFHTFWDAAPAYMHKDWTCEDFHKHLDKWSKKKIAKVVQGTAEDWARVNGKEMRAVYSLIPIDAEYTKLSEEDRARALMICETQMLRGAYRLAYVLNEIFEN